MNHTAVTGTVNFDDRITRARRVFDVIVQPQSYRNVAYLLLGLPLGIGWFTVLVAAAVVATSMLVVALVGIPLLVAFWYLTRVIANIERRIADALLGQQLSTVPINLPSGNLWTRLRALSAGPGDDASSCISCFGFPSAPPPSSPRRLASPHQLRSPTHRFYARYHDNPTFGVWSMSSHIDDLASDPVVVAARAPRRHHVRRVGPHPQCRRSSMRPTDRDATRRMGRGGTEPLPGPLRAAHHVSPRIARVAV
jgi:hypothetical protein